MAIHGKDWYTFKLRFQVLWLKRDLRWHDHDALAAALQGKTPLLALYIWEPQWYNDPHHSPRQAEHIAAALQEMRKELGPYSHQLLELEGDATSIFQILAHHGLKEVHAHREHGLQWTYQRDIAISNLLKKENIPFKEYNHNGVLRGIKNRKHWDEAWRDYMQREIPKYQLKDWPLLNQDDLARLNQAFKDQGVQARISESKLPFGREHSRKQLERFLQSEAKNYQSKIGEPAASRQTCSRLSTALAWGCLSLREVYQAALQAHKQAQYKSDLRAFISRLHWHSHFIQKFEMEMRMESENLNRAYNTIRQDLNPQYLEAWKKGQTGYPLVDACMRAVKETGYLNFRMRAMVISFWSHILWQPWQAAAQHLAFCFDDYLPGIHYPQVQMQSSTTGINTIRVYNPVKQSLEKDAEAVFISKWLPELQNLPLPFKHEPWKLSSMEQGFYGFTLGEDYPYPIVDFAESANFARQQLWELKADPSVKAENKRILGKHTVAKRNISQRTQTVMLQKKEAWARS